jgi:hypothetical protein
MKAYGGVDVYIHVFLTSAIVGGEWLVSRPGRFAPGVKTPRNTYRKLCGPRSRSEPSERRGEEKNLAPTRTRTPTPPGRPARSNSLY